MGVSGPLVLLFALSGGYVFLHSCYLFKHRWTVLEWEQNIFEASFWGIGFFVATRALVALLGSCGPCQSARTLIETVLPFPYAASLLFAPFLALLVAVVVNLFIPQNQAIHHVVREHGGTLLKLLDEAAVRELPVMLTMQNRKVYVGSVIAQPSPNYPYTRILPWASGYRRERSLTVRFTTAYRRVYEDLERRRTAGEVVGLEVEDFGIVLPMSQICSAHFFDHRTYSDYFQDRTRPDELPRRGKAE
jgi:hypothetical protein